MFKRISVFLVYTIVLIAFCGCDNKGSYDNNNIESTKINVIDQTKKQETGLDRQNKNQLQQEEKDIIKEQIKKMTLDEKIGQMVIVGVDDYTNNSHSKEMIEQYHVGGFILFKRNIKDANQAVSLINSLKETNAINKQPLFIGIDEEGGRVTRMPGEFIKLPTNKVIGRVNNGDYSFNIGKAIARELKAFGMNMDFAPVLDINSNPANPVIGDRAFGSNAEIVSKLGIETMKGIQSQGVVSVVKHFPGHGDTSEDSHIGLPVVNNDLNRLKSFELLPFFEAIKTNADAVMIAHILLPKVDEVNPSSLSKTIITDILRKDLKFNGVVITDDMTMGAIIKKYDIGAAAIKSINAGSDIILVCHDYEKEVSVLKALKEAVKAGDIHEDTINNSVYRIIKLKQKYNLKDEKVDSIDVEQINSAIKGVLDSY